MADFLEISILEAAMRCGIKVIDSGKVEVAVNCIFCNDSKKHMRLNTVKNVFYCPRCGEGGNAITLYAKLTGTNNKTAYHELIDSNTICPTIIPKQVFDTVERVPLPLAERHTVYTELLETLDLSTKHKDNLLNRGLDSNIIKKNLYRTTPDVIAANRIARELAGRFSLTGVPGFYTKDKAWKMSLYKGFFVPVRSDDGLIQGLQIRLDDVKNRKYCWFTSRYKENGTQAHAWIHTANNGGNIVFITEGALKADVAAYLSNHCFIGLPGVNCTNEIIPLVNSMGVKSVYEAMDMDKCTNKNVASAACDLHRKLAKAGINCIPCEWDFKYKGIDDYLLGCV